jgi:uncharacterized membrane protein
MEGKAKFLGHPIHPILIVFPLGLLATSVIFDLLFYFSIIRISPEVGFWMAVSGIIGGLVSSVFGLIDWLAVPSDTRAKRVGFIHGLVNLGVLILFTIGVYTRIDNLRFTPGFVAIAFSVAGALLAVIGGWLGGELVHRLNVGNDQGANLNAPNSLWGEKPNTDRFTVRINEK